MTSSKLLLIFGGRSAEHEVSLRSATEVAQALDRQRFTVDMLAITRDGLFRRARRADQSPSEVANDGEPVSEITALIRQADVVFPILHGPYGEDGCIQGLLEVLAVPYVGTAVLGSALCMDKAVFKRYLSQQAPEIPQIPWIEVKRDHLDATLATKVAQRLGFPCFVKPANQGSSIGVHKVRMASELAAALEDALRFDPIVVIERGLEQPRELELAVLGNGEPSTIVSRVGEIGLPPGVWYDYETKYLNDQAALHLPAMIDPALEQTLQGYALAAFRACRCAGLARIDFLLDRSTQAVYLNEINTLPGFTSISMYPKLMGLAGISYTELITALCDLALARAHARQSLALVR